MKICKPKRIASLFCAVFIACTCSVMPAFADMGFSEVRTVGVGGHEYSIESLIHNFNRNELRGQTDLRVNAYVPTGYLGSQAIIYSDKTGAAVASSSWLYNDSEANKIFSCVSYYTTSGYYFCQGKVKIFNGREYSTIDSYRTPNYSPKPTDTSPNDITVQIQRNQRGEVYGSQFFLNQMGIQPDLILAQGNNGVIGYARREDWDNNVTTPEEAITFMTRIGDRTIPLYDCDGNTVVDTFTFQAVDNLEDDGVMTSAATPVASKSHSGGHHGEHHN